MTAGEAGYRLGYAAFPVILLAIAAFLGWRMGRKREPAKFVAWPMAAAAVLVAVGMIGMLGLQMKKKADAPPPTSEAR